MAQSTPPNALLSIDQHRSTVIDRVVAEWGAALTESNAGINATQLRQLLQGMRADQLLAASLAGSLEGLRDVIAGTLTDTAAVSDQGQGFAKAIGDAGIDVVYTPVTPCRLVETRGSFPAVYQGAGAFTTNQVRTYTLQGGNGVCLTQLPAGLAPGAVQLQVFGIPTSSGSGDIEILPQGGTFGSTATLVYLGNNAFTSTGTTSRINPANNQISVQVRGAGAHVAIDVVGYFKAPSIAGLPPGALASSWDSHYGVCRGVDPKCYNNWTTTRQDRVLIFSRTAGPRHANLGTALAAGVNPPLNANNVALTALKTWLEAEGIVVNYTEDVTQIPGLGSTYKAVIFLSTSRDALWAHGRALTPTLVNTTTNGQLDAAKVNLRQYIRGGGGFVGIHNAFGTEYNWPWYEGLLGNANYYNHGNFQNGTVRIVGSADSATAGLPATFPFRDEWYNLVPYPTNVKFLATVDESSLATLSDSHPGHANFHPVAWCQYYDGGRAFLTTLGHESAAFQDGSGSPGQAEFKKLLVQGIKSAMGLTPFCTK